MKLRWYLLATLGLILFNSWCWRQWEENRRDFRSSVERHAKVAELASQLRILEDQTRGKVIPVSRDQPFQSELMGALTELAIPRTADSQWSATTVLEFEDLAWQLKQVSNPIEGECTLEQMGRFLKWAAGTGGRYHLNRINLTGTESPDDDPERELWRPEFSLYFFEAR